MVSENLHLYLSSNAYKMITQYKNLGLFDGISVEKLRLKNEALNIKKSPHALNH